jgi:hypothetical protein
MEIPDPSDLPRTGPGIDMTSFETPTPDLPVRPVEMSASVPLAETDRSSILGARTSYLTEWRLDLTGVKHMTPGLHELADLPLGQLMCETQGGEGGWVFLWQEDGDGGGDVNRPHTHTVVRVNCRLGARFDLRIGTSKEPFSKYEPGVDVRQDAVLQVILNVVPDETGDYAGVLRLWVTVDGQKVSIKTAKGEDVKDLSITDNEMLIKAKDAKDLKRKGEELNGRLEKLGDAGFFVPRPATATLSRENPLITQKIVGHARWKPDADKDPDSEGCPLDVSLFVHWRWVHAPLVTTPRDSEGGNTVVGSGQVIPHQDEEGTDFWVLPIYHYWSVENPNRCCDADGPHRVIQFARVVYYGEHDRWRKGHDWTLDIPKTEKQLAQKKHPYDPTFRNDPRGTNPGGSLVGPAPTGEPAIRQMDAPGITKERYHELALSKTDVIVHFQFMAFLVCPPAGASPKATDYLDRAKVVRVALFSIEWRFHPKAGRETTPEIVLGIKEVKNVRCLQELRAFIDTNGLMDAFTAPVPAESLELDEKVHKDLGKRVADAKIGIPKKQY